MNYSSLAVKIRETEEFAEWLGSLRDRQARARIIVRIRRFELGNFGDVKPVGEGVSEARITYGPGYRLYFVQQGDVIVIMLCGGDKKTQAQDIERAKKLRKDLE